MYDKEVTDKCNICDIDVFDIFNLKFSSSYEKDDNYSDDLLLYSLFTRDNLRLQSAQLVQG